MISKEKLVEIIKSTPTRPGGYAEYSDIADRILLALEHERVGEVVLAEGDMDGNMDMILDTIGPRLDGKRGVLIFREQEGK